MQRVTYFLSCIEDLANCPLKSRGVLQKAASQVFFYNGNTQQRKGTTQESLKGSVPRGSRWNFDICIWNSEESFNLIVLLFGEVVGFSVGGLL
jgi:hypothetical protein